MLKIIKQNEFKLNDLPFMADIEAERAAREIIFAVQARGDKALIEFTKKFDNIALKTGKIKVSQKEIDQSIKKVPTKFIEALQLAIKNITDYHQKQKPEEFFETKPNDVVLGLRAIPIQSAGIYVPGGTASYPSSVLMNAIPAKIAGAEKIVMVTPPSKGGKINPYVLAAAKLVGITEIYKVGGAQAVAALAFGTETIPRVDKIVGPGNKYVTLAKKMLYGVVGIDKLAGPSDVVIVADRDAEPEFIAADMLSQAEHDPESSAILITDSKDLAKKVNAQITKQIAKLKRKATIQAVLDKNSKIILVEVLKQAIPLINQIAPEHLELLTSSPQFMLEGIKNAGAVFMGPYSPVVVGDYMAGPNHVLPTGRTARFSSPLGVSDFIKTQSIIGYTKPALKEVWQQTKLLAEIEGLDAHARAVEIRFKN